MTRTQLILLAAGGSAALLIGAWTFQALGYPPCKLCYWQRYPHMAAVVIGLLAVAASGRLLSMLGALAALATAGVGLYHTGVERGWWEGPTTCTSGSTEGLSAEQLLNQILEAPLVRCDDVAWEFLSLSMASWNMILSLALVGFWIAAARKSA